MLVICNKKENDYLIHNITQVRPASFIYSCIYSLSVSIPNHPQKALGIKTAAFPPFLYFIYANESSN